MQILFLDESGTAPNKPGRQRYFVLGGVVIPEGVWHQVEKELQEAKSKFGIFGEIKWRFFSPHNKDKGNSILHLGESDRNQFRDNLCEIITSRRSLRILSVVTSVDAAYDLEHINSADELYHFTYKPITERFQYYLQDIERGSGVDTYVSGHSRPLFRSANFLRTVRLINSQGDNDEHAPSKTP